MKTVIILMAALVFPGFLNVSSVHAGPPHGPKIKTPSNATYVNNSVVVTNSLVANKMVVPKNTLITVNQIANIQTTPANLSNPNNITKTLNQFPHYRNWCFYYYPCWFFLGIDDVVWLAALEGY